MAKRLVPFFLLILLIHGLFSDAPKGVAEKDFSRIQELDQKAANLTEEGKYVSAAVELEHLLDILKKYPDIFAENCIDVEMTLARVYMECGNLIMAENHYKNALSSCRKLYGENDRNTAAAYNQLAGIYVDEGLFKKALGYYQKSLSIMERIAGDDDVDTCAIYNNIGQFFYLQKDYDNAILYFEKALHIFELNDNPSRAYLYQNMGAAYGAKGDRIREYSYYKKAESVFVEHNGENHPENISVYANLAQSLYYKNEYAAAAQYWVKTLAIIAQSRVFTSVALSSVNSLADFFTDLGSGGRLEWVSKQDGVSDTLDAMYKELAPQMQKITETRYDVRSPLDVSLLLYDFSLYVLENFTDTKKSSDVAYCCQKKGFVYTRKKDYAKALDLYEQALKIYKKAYSSKHPALGDLYSNIAEAYYEQGKLKNALSNWQKALSCYKDAESYGSIIDMIKFILAKDISDKALIKKALKISMDAVESARMDMVSMKSKFLAQALPLYYYGIEFSMRNKDTGSAFSYAESMKNRGFLDQLGTAAALELDGVTDEEKSYAQELIRNIEYSRDVLEKQNSLPLSEQDSGKLAAAAKSVTDSERLLSDFDRMLTARISQYALLRNPSVANAKEAMSWCGNDRAILEYVIWNPDIAGEASGGKRLASYCLVITADKIQAVKLDEGFDYTGTVTKLHDSIASITREGRFELARNSLYEKLIEPVLPYIQGVKRLMIVPDGNLSLLPFEALRKDFDSPMLGDQYEVSLSPSVSVSMLAGRAKSRGGPVLAFGGAWYDTTLTAEEHDKVLRSGRGYESAGHWHDLPGTVTELNALRDDVFAGQTFEQMMQESASESQLKRLSTDKKLKDYSILHFACHGHFNAGNSDEPSSLLFSEISGRLSDTSADDGYLTVPEAAVLELGADMVCLSACETGLVDVEHGDGIVGLSRAFMVAGAGHVGVSLWEADDEAAAAFMTSMYRKVVNEGLDYAAAYHKTKAEFRESDDWDHPFYWAVYTLYE